MESSTDYYESYIGYYVSWVVIVAFLSVEYIRLDFNQGIFNYCAHAEHCTFFAVVFCPKMNQRIAPNTCAHFVFIMVIDFQP